MDSESDGDVKAENVEEVRPKGMLRDIEYLQKQNFEALYE